MDLTLITRHSWQTHNSCTIRTEKFVGRVFLQATTHRSEQRLWYEKLDFKDNFSVIINNYASAEMLRVQSVADCSLGTAKFPYILECPSGCPEQLSIPTHCGVCAHTYACMCTYTQKGLP